MRILYLLLLLPCLVMADGSNNNQTTTNNYYPSPIPGSSTSSINGDTGYAALGFAAAQADFDYGRHAQWAINAATVDDEWGATASLGKRFGDGKDQCRGCILLKVTLGIDDIDNDIDAAAVGISGKF